MLTQSFVLTTNDFSKKKETDFQQYKVLTKNKSKISWVKKYITLSNFFVLFLSSVVFLTIIVWQYQRISVLSDDVSKLDNRILSIKNKNDVLNAELNQLSSYDEITKKASKFLGMKISNSSIVEVK